MKTKMSEKAQAAMETVVQRFKDGDLSPIVDAVMIRRDSDDNAPWMKRSFNNMVMALVQTGVADVRTYKQWKTAGRQVQKGSNAAWLWKPITRKIEDKTSGEEKVIATGFQTFSVHPVYNTEGDAVPEFDYSPEDRPDLLEIAENAGVEVTYQPYENGGALGFYCPGKGQIVLMNHSVRTLAHELAHWGHEQISDSNLKGGQHADQETIAELAAACICSMYGDDTTGNAWKYISAYNPDDPMAAIGEAVSEVGKVLEYIFAN